MEIQIQSEKTRWREVLKRLLDCIKFLAAQNLPFRGHNENLNSSDFQNVGNFKALLNLIEKYDPLMARHLEKAQDSPGSTLYLSPLMQNEFISILASTVRNKLISDIKKSKYFGILYDSTPDLQHREQFSEVIRHIDIDFDKKEKWQ